GFLPPLWAMAGSMIYALLPPVVAYASSSLETPFYSLIGILALERTMRSLTQPKVRWQALALACFSVIVRPDGAILLLVVGTTIGLIVFREYWLQTHHWVGAARQTLGHLLLQLLPGVIILVVGIGAHWLYYGTAFPNTLTAKANGYQIDLLRNAQNYLYQMILAQPSGIPVYILAIIGAIVAFRQAPELLVFALWYVVYHVLFIARAPLFDWYLQVPLFALSIFAGYGLAKVVQWALALAKQERREGLVSLAITALLAVALGIANVPYDRGRYTLESNSESVEGNLGRWLAAHSQPNDTVFTETLGFIGYYASHDAFIDWPGLSSKDATSVLSSADGQTRFRQYILLINHFEPRYLALRQDEWDSLKPELQPRYALCADFPAPDSPSGGYVVACHAGTSTASQ
ncbi:MAG TPA: hypothetical protein VMT24_17095, partial [Aggregatilineaceae bacterium]|nr:hypothetical protein [Aggregatilineaceae bacterium]